MTEPVDTHFEYSEASRRLARKLADKVMAKMLERGYVVGCDTRTSRIWYERPSGSRGAAWDNWDAIKELGEELNEVSERI
ncbi:hypothetical protein QE359_003663 [Curtobacterium sp. SORGH_AS776]|nr:hypothetical protein [Curtobacterium sp. SORGH_AS_0776]